jgi:CheY-like chemotaxis protein
VTSAEPPLAARVVIVDDASEVRTLLRLTFATDDRFELVGEGSNGHEAIELAERLRPDLIVLDRHMPGLGGLEAVREIAARWPDTAVVLYSAGIDPGTHEAAIAAGALHVADKSTLTIELVDTVARLLVEHWSTEDAEIEVTVGPVSSQVARVWVANTQLILEAVRSRPDIIDPPIPEDVLDTFVRFLTAWGDVAAGSDEFVWVGRASPEDVERIVESWSRLDAMSDQQLAILDCSWSSPEGRPFFHALTAGVLDALSRHEKSSRLATALAEQWPPSA